MKQCASEPTPIECHRLRRKVWRLFVEGLVIFSLERIKEGTTPRVSWFSRSNGSELPLLSNDYSFAGPTAIFGPIFGSKDRHWETIFRISDPKIEDRGFCDLPTFKEPFSSSSKNPSSLLRRTLSSSKNPFLLRITSSTSFFEEFLLRRSSSFFEEAFLSSKNPFDD